MPKLLHGHPAVDAAHPRVDLSPRSMDQAYLPTSVLYATSARIGGVGLDAVALETLRGLKDQLGLAIAYGLRTSSAGEQFSTADVWLSRRHLAKNLNWHPVRLLSNLQSRYYYASKKRAVDSVAAKSLRTGRFDLFHGWSGEALPNVRAAPNRLTRLLRASGTSNTGWICLLSSRPFAVGFRLSSVPFVALADVVKGGDGA
jgi:hypothetical protein